MLNLGAGLDRECTEVVDLRFAFYNKNMLKLLTKRANALQKTKFTDMHKIEDKMDSLKNSEFSKLRTPNMFYCTFENAKTARELKKLIAIPFM